MTFDAIALLIIACLIGFFAGMWITRPRRLTSDDLEPTSELMRDWREP